MLDERDLQAIAQLMDAKLAQQKTELQAEIRASESHMMALMEAYFEPKFNLLADGQKLIQEKMIPAEELEDIHERLDLLEAITRRNVRDIEKLKKAQ